MAAGFVGKHCSTLGKWGMLLTGVWIWSSEERFTLQLWVCVGHYPEFTVCLWENNSTFYSLTCILGKMARGLYSPVDLAGVWDGVVIAVHYSSLVYEGKIKSGVFSSFLSTSSLFLPSSPPKAERWWGILDCLYTDSSTGLKKLFGKQNWFGVFAFIIVCC